MEIEEIRNYCLNCPTKPCEVKGCPIHNKIPEFIHEENEEKAFYILSETTVLPAICSRVCQVSKQCKGVCVRGIRGESVEINKMEMHLADNALKNNYKFKKKKNPILKEQKKVCIIGGGPSGLTAAAFLAMDNAKVTIIDKNEKLGGLLEYGIPDFRLDRSIIEKTIQKILELGVDFKLNTEVGRDISIEEILKEYDAVYISAGANEPIYTLSGENVLSGNKLLEELNKEKIEKGTEKSFIEKFKGKKIGVSGGGNVAMDVSRTLARMGAEVSIIYRRGLDEMPAEKEEIEMAKKENVEFLFQNNILKFDSENKEAELIKTNLVKKEGDTRLSPVNIEGSNYKKHLDYLVLATGAQPNDSFIKKLSVEQTERGYIKINENYQTSKDKIFAGGDIAETRKTVVNAAYDGREAAQNILQYLLK